MRRRRALAGPWPGHLAVSHVTTGITAHRAGGRRLALPGGDRTTLLSAPGTRSGAEQVAVRPAVFAAAIRAWEARSAVRLACRCPVSAGARRYQLARTRVPFPARRDWPTCWPQGAGELRAGELRTGEVRAGQVGVGEVRAGQVRASQIRAGKPGAAEVCAGKVRADKLRGEQIRPGQDRAGEHRAGEVGSLRSASVRSAPAR